MVWWNELKGDWVLGSLVMEDKILPFRLELGSGELVLDDFVGGGKQRELGPEERRQAEKMVRLAAKGDVKEVRLGQYRCHTCNRWIPASGGQWSYGLCLSCSMDRDSDRWS